MKTNSSLIHRLSFFLVQALPFFLIACATSPESQISPKEQSLFSPYTPVNTERLKTDIEGCKGTAQYHLGDQKGRFEVFPLIPAELISSDFDSADRSGNETVDTEVTLSSPGDDEYSEDDEYISNEPVDVGKDLVKIAKIFAGVGFAFLGAVAGNAVGQSLGDAGEYLGDSITALGAGLGVKTMTNAVDEEVNRNTSGVDSRMVLNVVSSWEPAAIEKTKTCLSEIGYSFLPQ
jgi:hypothetical protein